jgi:hypothetical protein
VFRHQCPCRRPQNPPGWNNLALSPGCSQLSPLGTVLMNWLVAVVSWLGTISYNWASRRLPFGMTLTLAPRSQRAWSNLCDPIVHVIVGHPGSFFFSGRWLSIAALHSCWWCICVSNFVWTCKRTSPPS